MIALDMTVVNVALPSIATGLRFTPAGLSWVLNAYALTFGGLLLFGGRLGDVLGRRRVFSAGVALFTLASLAGGLATSAPLLLAARALQGVGGAIATPAVLALIVSSFPEGRERTRALGIFTGVMTGGASLGLVVGGMITQWFSWRWVMFVNVPIGAAVILGAPRLLSETERARGSFDLAGAITSVTGMSALVYGFIRAASNGWGDTGTLAAFGAAVALLALFVVIERRTSQPITPLRLFADLGRSGSYVARLLIVAGMFGMFFFLTQFVQDILGFTPLRAGLAFAPMTVTLFAVSRLAPRLVPRFGSRPLMIAGMVPVITALAWLTRISPATTYLSGVLGPMLLLGAGMGVVFVPLTMASLHGVRPEESGAAASMVNVTQQVGGALGLAILVTIFGNVTKVPLRGVAHAVSRKVAATGAAPGPVAQGLIHQILTHGMAISFTTAAIFDITALAVIALAIRMRSAAAAVAVPAR